MTQQFKFGDIVRRKSDGAIGVVIHAQFQSVWFVLKGNTVCNADYAKEFEIVPHPDTARLDWLARNDCSLTERLCDEDGDRLDTPFAVIQKQEEHFEVLAAACDIREAIDAAIRYCARPSRRD